MKLIGLGLLLCTGWAWGQAATPQAIAAECVRQMDAGVCVSRPDRTKIVPGQTLLISGAGRVSYTAYADYMDLYKPSNPGDTAMCQLALRYLNTEPLGDHAKIARALWTPQSPAMASPVASRPTAARSVAPHESASDIAWKIAKIALLLGVAYAAFQASRKA